ncbi:hypothetical protein FRC01_001183, partial [Tulasnella sp. 417]
DGKGRTFLALGEVLCLQGEYAKAQDTFKEALAIFTDIAYEEGRVAALEMMSAISSSQAQPAKPVPSLTSME